MTTNDRAPDAGVMIGADRRLVAAFDSSTPYPS